MAKKYLPKRPGKQKRKSETGFWKRLWQRLGIVEKIGGGVLLIFGIILLPKTCNEVTYTYEPEYKQHEDDTFIKGILLPYSAFKEGRVYVGFGSFSQSFPITELTEGAEFIPDAFKCEHTGKPPFRFKIKLSNNRLYFSDSIRYYDDNKLIGVLNYNKWEVKKQSAYRIYNTDQVLEIYDEEGNLAFGINYENDYIISLQGYFLTDDNMASIGTGYWACLDPSTPNWKSIARQRIKEIPIPRH